MGVGVWTTYSAWTGGVKAGASTAIQVFTKHGENLSPIFVFIYQINLPYKPLHFPPILRQGKVSWRIPAKSPHTFVPYLCHLIRAAPSHPDNFAYTRTFD